MPTYGYARVSRDHQELDIQLAELHEAGCERIFCEKESGAKDDRRELKRMLRALKAGDVVIVSALTFFPALSLSPIVEHFLMQQGRLF